MTEEPAEELLYVLSTESAYPIGVFTGKAHVAAALLSLPRKEIRRVTITAYPLNELNDGQAIDLDEIPGVAERTLTDQELVEEISMLVDQTLTGWISEADKRRLSKLKAEQDQRLAP